MIGDGNFDTIDANALAEQLLGDAVYANIIMLGFAWQRGLVPISLQALLRAIELNGVTVERNKQAFAWGRIAAADPDFLPKADVAPEAETLRLASEQFAWQLRQHTRAVAALAIGSDGATVTQVGYRLDGFGDDVMRRLAAEPRDEAHAAGVVLEPRVIQTCWCEWESGLVGHCSEKRSRQKQPPCHLRHVGHIGNRPGPVEQ